MEVKILGGEGRVFAIGDVTSVPLPGRFKPDVGLSLPKAGVIAEGQGEVVANESPTSSAAACPPQRLAASATAFSKRAAATP